MLILSVDTASGIASTAIMKDGRLLSFSSGKNDSMQAESLFTHIEKVLGEAKFEYKDFDYFAANLGPGSFTGIRIGLSAITAICFALNKKLVGISSLEALAYKQWNHKQHTITTSLDAGREGAYYNEFEINSKGLITSKNDGELIDIKDANPSAAPNAADIAIAAHYKLINNIADFTRKTPIYIRKPDAKLKNVQ